MSALTVLQAVALPVLTVADTCAFPQTPIMYGSKTQAQNLSFNVIILYVYFMSHFFVVILYVILYW